VDVIIFLDQKGSAVGYMPVFFLSFRHDETIEMQNNTYEMHDICLH
jgi:hypothetical protein